MRAPPCSYFVDRQAACDDDKTSRERQPGPRSLTAPWRLAALDLVALHVGSDGHGPEPQLIRSVGPSRDDRCAAADLNTAGAPGGSRSVERQEGEGDGGYGRAKGDEVSCTYMPIARHESAGCRLAHCGGSGGGRSTARSVNTHTDAP